MEKRIKKSEFKKYFNLLEHADNLRRSIEAADSLFIDEIKADKKSIYDAIDCVVGSLDNLYCQLYG